MTTSAVLAAIPGMIAVQAKPPRSLSLSTMSDTLNGGRRRSGDEREVSAMADSKHLSRLLGALDESERPSSGIGDPIKRSLLRFRRQVRHLTTRIEDAAREMDVEQGETEGEAGLERDQGEPPRLGELREQPAGDKDDRFAPAGDPEVRGRGQLRRRENQAAHVASHVDDEQYLQIQTHSIAKMIDLVGVGARRCHVPVEPSTAGCRPKP